MEPKDLAAISSDIKEFTEVASRRMAEADARLLHLEQRVTSRAAGIAAADATDIASTIVESEQFKSFVSDNKRRSERIPVATFNTKTLVNATGQNQPLVPSDRRPGVVGPGQQQLTLRDILPNIPTSSNLVEFARETGHTDNTAIQANEGDVKGEDALTFDLQYSPVRTIASWIPTSVQILQDAQALQNYISNRLLYFNALKVENELLNGSGVGTEILGIIPQATAFDTGVVNTSTDTYIDIIGLALTQASTSLFSPDAIILNKKDWSRIQRIKTSTGEYIYTDPHNAFGNQLWNTLVIPTYSIPESQFLVGNFALGAAVWDRMQATVEVSREHSDFFVRNLAAILCESRLALTVYRPTAFVSGGFPFGS